MKPNKTIMILTIITILITLTGCDTSQISEQVTDKVIEEIRDYDLDKLIVCNKPYMRFGTGCCLDNNNNSLCDTDDKLLADLEEEVKEKKEKKEKESKKIKENKTEEISDLIVNDIVLVNETVDEVEVTFVEPEPEPEVEEEEEEVEEVEEQTEESVDPFCGDGICSATEQEDCGSCQSDCGCDSDEWCNDEYANPPVCKGKKPTPVFEAWAQYAGGEKLSGNIKVDPGSTTIFTIHTKSLDWTYNCRLLETYDGMINDEASYSAFKDDYDYNAMSFAVDVPDESSVMNVGYEVICRNLGEPESLATTETFGFTLDHREEIVDGASE